MKNKTLLYSISSKYQSNNVLIVNSTRNTTAIKYLSCIEEDQTLLSISNCVTSNNPFLIAHRVYKRGMFMVRHMKCYIDNCIAFHDSFRTVDKVISLRERVLMKHHHSIKAYSLYRNPYKY